MIPKIIFCLIFVIPVFYCFVENKDGLTISLKRFKTAREQYLNGPDLRKFGLPIEEFHKKHHKGNRTNDTISLTRYLDNEFYGEIVIGHPGQKLKVSFDTAWSLSWVMSSQCSSWKTPGCWFHNKYDHTKSSEYKKDGRPYAIDDGTLKLKGFYSYDNISIAHSNVTNQSFVEMVEVSKIFMLNKADGILGLGLKTDDYNPFFYTLLRQKKIKNAIFSIYLNRDRQSSKGGSISLGFIEYRHIHVYPNKTKEPIKYLPVLPGKFWKFQVDGIFLDMLKPDHSEDLKFCQKGCNAIVDTSSNAIIGPIDDINAISTKIGAKPFILNRFTVDCETINKLPRIGFVLGGQNFNLSGPDYIIKLSIGPTTFCVSAFQTPETTTEQEFWIIGGAFLAKYYSIYNILERTIGFVRAA